MSTRYCIVIPNYNHAQVIDDTVSKLQKYALPIILVDDGSDSETQQVLLQVEKDYSNVTLFRREQNGGKGAAVNSGLMLASEMQMTHALQIDADGQHDLNDIEVMLQESHAYPESLISGQPQYDQSISKGRYYGRYLTHVWVHIESLSLSLKDSMCGFRVYPVQEYVDLASTVTLGKRMDFDIEVMVRLYWKGVNVRFIPTKVHYPENGISHFNLWNDNWLITKMHTKLFFGMLLRSPMLLSRKLSKSS